MVEDRSVDLVLNENADNFINVYANRVANSMNYADVFLKNMRELITDLESIDLALLYDKLLFRMRINNLVYDLTDVSDGTLKALILNLLINSPIEEKHSLLTIDEPETNLHPAWQKVIGQWILYTAIYILCPQGLFHPLSVMVFPSIPSGPDLFRVFCRRNVDMHTFTVLHRTCGSPRN
jgi:hypothetical protein